MTIKEAVDRAKISFPLIEQELVYAIMDQESNFNPDALRYEPHINDSSIGLMQILTNTARMMGMTGTKQEIHNKLFDIEINVYYGVKYLDDLRKTFNGNIKDMISGYNAGAGNVKHPYINQAYVNAVYKKYIRLKTMNTINSYMPLTLGAIALNTLASNKDKKLQDVSILGIKFDSILSWIKNKITGVK